MSEILGIEIKKDAIVAVLANIKGKKYSIVNCQHLPLESPDFEKNHFIKELKAIITKVLKNRKKIRCIVSISPDFVTSKNLTVPFKGYKNIEQIFLNELDGRTVTSINEKVADFSIINFANEKESENSNILAAMCDGEIINLIEAVLASFKLKISFITISGAYSVAQNITDSDKIDPVKNYLFIDVQKNSASISFVNNKQIISLQSVISNSKQKQPDHIAATIKRTLCLFQDSFAFDLSPDLILLSGEISSKDELERSLKKHIPYLPEFKTINSNDFVTFKMSSGAQWIEEKMYNAKALLSLHILNKKYLDFSSKPITFSETLKANKKKVFKILIILGVSLTLFIFGLMHNIFKIDKELERVENEIVTIFKKNFPNEKKIIKPVVQMRENIKNITKENILKSQITINVLVSDIINEISSAIPKQVNLSIQNLSIAKGLVVFEGETNDFNTIDIIQKRLEKKELFKSVKIVSANINKKTRKTNFKININLD